MANYQSTVYSVQIRLSAIGKQRKSPCLKTELVEISMLCSPPPMVSLQSRWWIWRVDGFLVIGSFYSSRPLDSMPCPARSLNTRPGSCVLDPMDRAGRWFSAPNSSSRLCEFLLFVSTFSRRDNRQTSVQKSRSYASFTACVVLAIISD